MMDKRQFRAERFNQVADLCDILSSRTLSADRRIELNLKAEALREKAKRLGL